MTDDTDTEHGDEGAVDENNGTGGADETRRGHDGDDSHDHDGGHDHDHHHHDVDSLGVGLLTVSSSRTIEADSAGDAIAEAMADAGHEIAVRELVPDDYDRVQDTVDRFISRDDVDCVVTTGGTGVTPDDVTIEAVEPLFDKRLPGFGELFRTLSYEEIDTRVVGTRAAGGIADGAAVFCLPGSENAARLGTEEILVAEAPHLVGLAGR